ncbi:MAG: cysteine hydrolase [bacterium]
MSAILIIDMCNDFFMDGRLKELRESLCIGINELSAWGRKNRVPIIWVRQEFKADLSDAFLSMRKKNISKTIEGTIGAEILPELHREPNDFEVIKKRYSSFFQTDLDKILEENKIEQLILCGTNTHACVRTTAVDAFQRDYEIIIASDCANSYDEEHHNVSLKYLSKDIARVMGNAEIMGHCSATKITMVCF